MAVDPTQVEWAENAYDERPMRICVSCGQKDRAPRDQVALPDGNTALYHKDCHAMLGCTVCEEELKVVANGHGPKGLKNEKLWLAILEETTKPLGEVHPVYTRDDVTGTYQRALDNDEIIDDQWERAE